MYEIKRHMLSQFPNELHVQSWLATPRHTVTDQFRLHRRLPYLISISGHWSLGRWLWIFALGILKKIYFTAFSLTYDRMHKWLC